MIIIKKDLIKKINKFEELRKYLSVVVDLNQEKNLKKCVRNPISFR